MQDATLDNTVGWEVDTFDRYIGGIHLRSAQLNDMLQHFLQGKIWLLDARPNVDKVFLRIIKRSPTYTCSAILRQTTVVSPSSNLTLCSDQTKRGRTHNNRLRKPKQNVLFWI